MALNPAPRHSLSCSAGLMYACVCVCVHTFVCHLRRCWFSAYVFAVDFRKCHLSWQECHVGVNKSLTLHTFHSCDMACHITRCDINAKHICSALSVGVQKAWILETAIELVGWHFWGAPNAFKSKSNEIVWFFDCFKIFSSNIFTDHFNTRKSTIYHFDRTSLIGELNKSEIKEVKSLFEKYFASKSSRVYLSDSLLNISNSIQSNPHI